MTQYRFEYLISLYKTGDLSPEEWDELREAIREGEHVGLLGEDIRRTLAAEGVHASWSPAVAEEMWRVISKEKRGRVIGSWRTVAAAAVMVAAVSMWWLLRQGGEAHPGAPMTPAARPVAGTDVHPGGTKAILTLANGQQIVLDSSVNGQIARQGHTTVIKLNGLISYTGGKGSGEVLYNTISTPRGGQFELILPDGSHVWLNSASELRFPTAFKGDRREVRLKGEGYFDIAKDAKRPFILDVNDMRVRVLGTSFNTMAYSEEGSVSTTLVDGAVSIDDGREAKVLQPGQQASFGLEGMRVKKADVRKVTAWRTGVFEFDNTDLASIMRQLSRWYDIEVVYKVAPDKSALGGSISRNLNLKEVLSLLEANGINHFAIEGKKVFVLP